MKKLELNQMENVEGAFSWNGCISSTLVQVCTWGWSAAAMGNWIGVGILAGGACIAGGLE